MNRASKKRKPEAVGRSLHTVVGRIGCFFGWHLWCWPLPEDGGLNLSEPPPPHAKCKKCGQLYGGKKQEQKQRDADALVKAYPIKLHSPCPPNPTLHPPGWSAAEPR